VNNRPNESIDPSGLTIVLYFNNTGVKDTKDITFSRRANEAGIKTWDDFKMRAEKWDAALKERLDAVIAELDNVKEAAFIDGYKVKLTEDQRNKYLSYVAKLREYFVGLREFQADGYAVVLNSRLPFDAESTRDNRCFAPGAKRDDGKRYNWGNLAFVGGKLDVTVTPNKATNGKRKVYFCPSILEETFEYQVWTLGHELTHAYGGGAYDDSFDLLDAAKKNPKGFFAKAMEYATYFDSFLKYGEDARVSVRGQASLLLDAIVGSTEKK
jgi:hypothetical protein